MKQLLLSDPHVLEIRHEKPWTPPKIDSGLWPQSFGNHSEQALELLVAYLENPYIIDDFENRHESRMQWRSTLENKYVGLAQYCQNNALRANRIVLILNVIVLANDYNGSEPDKCEALVDEIVQGIPDAITYNSRTTVDKIEVLARLKQRIRELLVFLSKQHPKR